MAKTKQLPERSQVKTADTWDLSSLFPDDKAWKKAFHKFESRIAGYERFRGKLGKDAGTLAACLRFDRDMDRLGERIGVYAFLKSAEDQASSQYQGLVARFVAPAVINLLEAVNVEQNQAQLASIAVCGSDVISKGVVKVASVVEAGQRVARRLLREGHDGEPKREVYQAFSN